MSPMNALRIFLVLVVGSAVFFYMQIRGAQPVISFVGVATGTLADDPENLEFKTRFDVTEHDLVAVLAFAAVKDGSEVWATWHSPDSRTVPLGRKIIQVQSGAKIAKFSFSNTVDWTPSPFQLDIRATTGNDNIRVATGSVQFFIGMTDEEVDAYKTSYEEYQTQRALARDAREAEEKRKAEDAANGSGEVVEQEVFPPVGIETP